MPIYLEMPHLNPDFPFRFLKNDGSILTTPHWHKEYELLLITQGEANLAINDQQFHIYADQIAFFNSGDVHYVVASPSSERDVYQFDLSFFSDVLSQHPDLDLTQAFSHLTQISTLWPKATQERLVTLLYRLAKEAQNPAPEAMLAVKSLIYQLVVTMIREIPAKDHQQTPLAAIRSHQILETLNQVFGFVEKNYTHKITLAEAAASVNFSEYYFARYFKKNVGQTFINFLNDYRLDKAKWALINTDNSITDILLNVGFTSSKSFYRLFKDRLGVSPKRYREAHKINS
ncbi:helix-turn-helix transcriptional regulator [Lacticaseibacillus saniviri]